MAVPSPESSSPGGLPFGGDKTGFAFADSDHGWLTGYSAANGIWLYSTSDADNTWQQQPKILPVPADPTAAQMYKDFPTTWPPVFTDEHDGVLPISGGIESQSDVFATVFYLTGTARGAQGC